MWSKLTKYAADKGIPLSSEVSQLFLQYYDLLTEGNKQMNLTRIIGPSEVVIKHVLDSLELMVLLPHMPFSVLDVGSGAGLPGLALKIANTEIQLTLLDASQKKVAFLQETSQQLLLENVAVIHGRAEDYGREYQYRERFPLVVSRAVARLNVLVELCLPFVEPGGIFAAYKGPEGDQECTEAENALKQLNSEVVQTWKYSLPENMGERVLILMRKNQPLSAKYPRKAGVPAKRPL